MPEETTIDKKPFYMNASLLLSIIISVALFNMWVMQWKYNHESRILYLEQKCDEQQEINKEVAFKTNETQLQLSEIRGDIKVIRQMLSQMLKSNEK